MLFGFPHKNEMYNSSGIGANLNHYWERAEGEGAFGRPKPRYLEGLTRAGTSVRFPSRFILFGDGHGDAEKDHQVSAVSEIWAALDLSRAARILVLRSHRHGRLDCVLHHGSSPGLGGTRASSVPKRGLTRRIAPRPDGAVR